MSPTRRAPKLLVIDPSVRSPEREGAAAVVSGWPGEAAVLRPALEPGSGPGPRTGYDAHGVVVLGSRASVHDPHPWLEALRGWLEPIVAGRVPRPLLGICFGHQLVAHLAGAEVGFAREDRTKLVGVGETCLCPGRLIPEEARLRVAFSHYEEVKDVPRGYRVVARRPSSELDGFEHERLPIFTFQFHPEARGEFLRSCGIPPAELDAGLLRDSRRILDAFQAVALAHARSVET